MTIIHLCMQHTDALYNMGIAYEKQGRMNAAFKVYNDVLAIDDMHPGANMNAANVLFVANRYKPAIGE